MDQINRNKKGKEQVENNFSFNKQCDILIDILLN